MEQREATQFIRPALIDAVGGSWADFGAGSGTFTGALAGLIGVAGRVFAVDKDPAALRALRHLQAASPAGSASITTVEGDVGDLDEIAELATIRLDGALFANVLHFLPNAAEILAQAAARLHPGGRLIVVEYDVGSASHWVPHPLPLDRFLSLAPEAGLIQPRVVARRKSRYRGSLYCAVAFCSVAATRT